MLKRMRSTTHVAVALATATSLTHVVDEAAEGRPWLVLWAVACALLPDLLEQGVRRCATRPDVVVALDPLGPDAMSLAEGVASAAAWTVARKRPCWLRIQPLPGDTTSPDRLPYVRFDAARGRVEAALADGASVAGVRMPPILPSWPDRFAIPSPEGLLLRFWPGSDADPRVRCTVLERGWPHGLPFALVVAALAWVVGGALAGALAALTLGAHLVVDHAGLLGVAWLAPFRRRRPPLGWRLWRGASPLANSTMAWLAGLVVFWNIARATDYLPWRPALPGLLVAGVALPWLAIRRTRRRSQR
jgi:hypothetical protein